MRSSLFSNVLFLRYSSYDTIKKACALFTIFKCSLFKESHKESCKFCTAKCSYPGCNQVIHRSKFESHEESCDYRYSECRVCNVHVDWKEDGKVMEGKGCFSTFCILFFVKVARNLHCQDVYNLLWAIMVIRRQSFNPLSAGFHCFWTY